MKKLILPIAFAITLVACNREETTSENNSQSQSSLLLNKSYIKTAKLKDQLAYKKHYLKEAVKTIKELGISTEDLVALASSQTNKKAEEKNTFLLKDLLSLAQSKNKKISKEINEEVYNLNAAFDNIDDVNYDISIYVPFIDKLIENKKSNPISRVEMASIQDDIYIFEQEEISEQVAFEGEVLNEDGVWTTYEQLITEEMAEELAIEGTPVVIVGLENESANEDGIIYLNDGTPIVQTPESSSGNVWGFHIGDMAVKSHKESWIGGKSEVTFKSCGEDPARNHFGHINFIDTPSDDFFTIKRYTRKQVRDQYLATLNEQVSSLDAVINGTEYLIAGFPNSAFYYLIYERDNWPTGKRERSFSYKGGLIRKIDFRSADGEYYMQTIDGTNINPNTYLENSSIKFRAYFK